MNGTNETTQKTGTLHADLTAAYLALLAVSSRYMDLASTTERKGYEGIAVTLAQEGLYFAGLAAQVGKRIPEPLFELGLQLAESPDAERPGAE